jgi:hypothetical protein
MSQAQTQSHSKITKKIFLFPLISLSLRKPPKPVVKYVLHLGDTTIKIVVHRGRAEAIITGEPKKVEEIKRRMLEMDKRSSQLVDVLYKCHVERKTAMHVTYHVYDFPAKVYVIVPVKYPGDDVWLEKIARQCFNKDVEVIAYAETDAMIEFCKLYVLSAVYPPP